MRGAGDYSEAAGERLVVVNDMDGTMIDDKAFFWNAAVILSENYPNKLNPDKFFSELRNYYIPADSYPNIKSYDFFQHVSDYGLNDGDVEELVRKRMSTPVMQDKYVHRFVFWFLQASSDHVDNHCGTIGKSRTQRLKLDCSGLARELDADHTHIIEEPKGPFLATKFLDQHGVLIDDKIVEGLPGGIKQYHMVHAGTPDIGVSGPGLRVVHSYSEVAELIGKMIGSPLLRARP